MKKGIMLVVLCWTFAAQAESVLTCMQKLPARISVFQNTTDGVFEKIPGTFRNDEKSQRGMGYTQSYSNGVCVATATLYNRGRTKIGLADAVNEQRRIQRRLRTQPGQVAFAEVNKVKNYLLKIRTVCTPRIQDADRAYRQAETMKNALTRALTERLENCVR